MRHFILTYNYSNKTNTSVGQIGSSQETFPNQSEKTKWVKENVLINYGEPESFVVIFTNVIEVSKEDYEEWLRE